jgi:hypothetical protein
MKGSTVISRLFRSPVGLVSLGPKMIQSLFPCDPVSNPDHPREATHGVGEAGTGSQPAIGKQYTRSIALRTLHNVQVYRYRLYIDSISTHSLLQ